jgi:hypothetical protein
MESAFPAILNTTTPQHRRPKQGPVPPARTAGPASTSLSKTLRPAQSDIGIAHSHIYIPVQGQKDSIKACTAPLYSVGPFILVNPDHVFLHLQGSPFRFETF